MLVNILRNNLIGVGAMRRLQEKSVRRRSSQMQLAERELERCGHMKRLFLLGLFFLLTTKLHYFYYIQIVKLVKGANFRTIRAAAVVVHMSTIRVCSRSRRSKIEKIIIVSTILNCIFTRPIFWSYSQNSENPGIFCRICKRSCFKT